MAINIGDAVLTFMGDATQLDLCFDQISENAEAKLVPVAEAAEGIGEALKKSGADAEAAGAQMSSAWQRVAQATVQNTAAQSALKAALDTVKKSGSEDVVTMLQLAAAQQNAAKASAELAAAMKATAVAADEENVSMKEATGTIALGGDLVGVQMPRHLRTFIASLPGVGAALEAAFAFTAVLVLIDILGKGVEKLIEWSEKSDKLHAGWMALDATFQDTSTHIQEEIEKQEQKFVQLTEGPVAALDFAMKHLRSTAMDTLKSITAELDTASQQFKDNSPWYEFFQGWSKGAKDIKTFNTALTEVMRTASSQHPEDPMAAYRAGLAKTKTDLDSIQTKYNNLLADLQKKGTSDLFDQNQMLAWEQQLKVLQATYHQLQQGVQEDDARAKTDAEEKLRAQQAQQLAELDADKQGKLARLALQDEINAIALEHGQISFAQEQQNLIKSENAKYKIEHDALEQQKDLTPDPSRQAAIQGQIEALEAQHQENLLKIRDDGYKHSAAQQAQSLEVMIAATRQGTQERVDLETGLLNFYARTWGTESELYQAQLKKVQEAKTAQVELTKKLDDDDRKSTEALASDKKSFNDKYYAYLVSTARMTAGELVSIQQKAAEEEYDTKRAALTKEIAALNPQELDAKKKLNAALTLLDQQHEEASQLAALQTADVIETSYKALGLKSSVMLDLEVANSKKAYDAIRNSATATYADILRAEEKVLQSQIGEALADGDKAKLQQYTAQLAVLQQEMEKLGLTAVKTQATMGGWLDNFGQKLKATRGELTGFQQNFDTVVSDASNTFGSAVQKWIQGQESLGDALREGLAAELATIAGKAAAWSLYFLAWGIADTFWNPARAGADFAAAGEFAAVAGIAGAASYAIAPHTATSSSSTGSSATSVTGQAPTSAPQPINAVNVQHFAEGGLVSSPTLAVLGDSVGGGSAREAALPLDHPEALRQIAEALGPYLQQAGGSGGGITVNVKGMISPDNLGKVVKNISTKVKKNQVTLYSSNSLRLTKRS